jgi:transcriptional regulator with PAS, ATPase and Fis domain
MDAGQNPGALQPDKNAPEWLTAGTLSEILAKTEKAAIENALRAAGNNRKKAAEMLGIHRSGLYQKINRYNIGTGNSAPD